MCKLLKINTQYAQQDRVYNILKYVRQGLNFILELNGTVSHVENMFEKIK